MAHLAIICPEDAGHLMSVGNIGVELARRGHRVTLVARREARAIAENLGLDLVPIGDDDFRFPFPHLLWAACWLIGAPYFAVYRHWVEWHIESAMRQLPHMLGSLCVDGMVIDQAILAGGTVAERLGLPHVTVASALPWNTEPSIPPNFTPWTNAPGRLARWRNIGAYAAWHRLLRSPLRRLNRHRRAHGLPPLRRLDDTFSRLAQISQLSPDLDFPRPSAPPHFHHIGSLAATRPENASHDFPWDWLDGRPLVYASLGTVPDGTNRKVLQRILTACAPLDAQVVLTIGKWEENARASRAMPKDIPANALVVDFAPQLELLSKATALITHAGINTVLEAITREVPMVALPRSADQPGMAARIQRAGIGLVGSFARSTPAQIRELVGRVLAEPSFRSRVRQMRGSIEAAGGVARAAAITERAIATRQPVCRP